MKNHRLYLRCICVAALGFGALAAAQEPAPVTVAQPEVRPAVERIELTGSFTARRAAQLSPRLSGLVETIDIDAGDQVAAGNVIVRLDDQLAELQLAQAEAAVAQSQASFDEAVRLRDEALRLGEDRFFPDTEIQARKSAVQVARAALDVARAERDTAAERLARHAIVAPFDGVIARRLTEAGEWVETGTAVAELVAVDDLWLDVQAPQRLWPRLRQDTGVDVVVDALGGRTFTAEVAARVPVSDPNARTFLLRLVLADADADITPGMSARVVLRLSSGADAVLVPRDALIRYPDGTITVYVVDDSSAPPRVRQREVVIGRVDGDMAVIEAGLDAGQPVVVRGNEVLNDGDAVRIVESGVAAPGAPGSDAGGS
ncbi:MAG TPA: efflux RND transporter periplasmic adaptor subunit [Wenzhouxiangellaceae bacterium]|nr:efflux RND transporter periplasmic adaptor subunit [Wenzhouxiangellaceae bacterium]